ncbi:hypothetical protein Cyagr_2472 [Cyanobium gracile PCC 6307]|uniref:Uncharacterized protein n=1 Tax=Cyanobium gracile (strain ATCC 27147 / PCC 6307) TaxID=292564 RepID=K9P9D9_CYAGP|nr:hypothetical protein Cyagr_2472 [Cyanobium gracile PCC 6307]
MKRKRRQSQIRSVTAPSVQQNAIPSASGAASVSAGRL